MPPMPGMPPMPPGLSPLPTIPGVSTPAGPGDDLSRLAEQMGGIKSDQGVAVAEELANIVQRLQALKDKDPRISELINKMLAPVLQGAPAPGGAGPVAGPVPGQMPAPGGPPVPPGMG
jgi:hypothetical protein